MKIRDRVLGIVEGLKKDYPQAECSLNYAEPYQLLFATRLSAQCTDARVNIVTKELYARFTTLREIAECDIAELEKIVHPCGVFRMKARDIRACANVLIEKFGGEVPDTMEDLLSLPGVGRKTANLILGDIFGKPAVVADTHCIRISNKLGLCNSTDPKKVEFRLKEIVPPDEQNMLCHRFVWHGRAVCSARSPKCEECSINKFCKTYEKNSK
ncbi:MAG: endonuclease III [Oscillospiraceae bacterium]|nr:endonuclease III [Oscillospiraceae bacterium]MBR2180424.1 endonuclease III [Oscillospiraceae bacterium]